MCLMLWDIAVHLAGYTSRRLGVSSANVLSAVSELPSLLLNMVHVLRSRLWSQIDWIIALFLSSRMCIFGISRYDLGVICATQCWMVVFVKVKRCVMELQILELLCSVSRNVTLLILSRRTDIVVIVGGTIVRMLRAEMWHFAVVDGIAWGHHDSLMLTVTCSSWSSSFADGVRVLVLAVRSVVDGLVPPVSCIHRTLRAFIILLRLLLVWLHGPVS